jgi:hypothetical protein
LQIPLRTASTIEAYIANEEWRSARLSHCPLHSDGSCSLSRHGSYERLTTPGVRIARWYCPEGRRTFSLLPDFLAARLPGLLASIENTVILAGSARSLECAADVLRGLDICLPSAVRWLRRRVSAVRASLAAVAAIAPRRMSSFMAEAVSRSDAVSVLLRLRTELTSEILDGIPAPLGFQRSAHRRDRGRSPDNQHDVGPDLGCEARYTGTAQVIRSSCTPTRPTLQPLSRPPPMTSVESGVPIDA